MPGSTQDASHVQCGLQLREMTGGRSERSNNGARFPCSLEDPGNQVVWFITTNHTVSPRRTGNLLTKVLMLPPHLRGTCGRSRISIRPEGTLLEYGQIDQCKRIDHLCHEYHFFRQIKCTLSDFIYLLIYFIKCIGVNVLG